MNIEINLESRKNIYIACDFIDTYWERDGLEQVIDLWNKGFSLNAISKRVSRTFNETALLIIDVSIKRVVFGRRDRGMGFSSRVNLTSFYNKKTKLPFLKKYKNGYEVFLDKTIDFIWDEVDVIRFDEMWNDGKSLEEIQIHLKRSPDDICILIIDRAEKGFINSREDGLGGWLEDVFEIDRPNTEKESKTPADFSDNLEIFEKLKQGKDLEHLDWTKANLQQLMYVIRLFDEPNIKRLAEQELMNRINSNLEESHETTKHV